MAYGISYISPITSIRGADPEGPGGSTNLSII